MKRLCLYAVDPLKPLLPKAWQAEPYFSKLDALVGVPVINVHMCDRDEYPRTYRLLYKCQSAALVLYK